MSKRPGDKARAVEALILLAATAAGAAGVWYCLGTKSVHLHIDYIRGTREVSPSGLTLRPGVGRVAAAVGVLMAAWSPALVGIARRRRRSGLEASARSPGLAACSATTLVSALYLSLQIIKAAFLGWPVESVGTSGFAGGPINGGWYDSDVIDGFAATVLPDMSRAVAPVAFGALLFSVAALRRRPRGRVEWAAFVLGLGWVVVGLLIAWRPPSLWEWSG